MSPKHKIVITEHARKDLCSLGKVEAERIIKKLRFFESADNPLDYAEPLKVPFLGKYRFRVGEYRIMFMIEPSGTIAVLFILNIKHRKDVYR
jgi:mRNA interferase RelE/StbE